MPALAVRPERQDPGAAVLEHASSVVDHRGVEAGAAQRAPVLLLAEDQLRPDARTVDHGGDRDRSAGCDRILHPGDVGEVLWIYPTDEQLDRAAAGQPDGERVVVSDAVADELRIARGEHRLRDLVDRAFDAAA